MKCSGSRSFFDTFSSSMWPPVSSYAAPLPQRLTVEPECIVLPRQLRTFDVHVSVLMRLISSPGSNYITSSQQLAFRFHPSCLASTRPDDPRSRPEQPRHRIRPPHGTEPDNSQPTNKVCAKKCGALKVDSDSRLWGWTGWFRRLCCRE